MKPRIPRRLLCDLTVSMLRGRSRPPLLDARRLLQGLPDPPLVVGRENVPAQGGYVVLANHYQRRDLWIGWGGSLLMAAVGRPIHWLTLRELRLAGRELRLTRGLFRCVAETYGFIPIPADLADHAGQAIAIRGAIRLLQAGAVVGLFPEGQRGHSGGLSAAMPGAAKLARLLSRYGPLLPAAIWEEGRSLSAALGPPLRLAPPSQEALMEAIAELLPPRLR